MLGALNGLLAMGLVLVYRTNRIINFAQGGLGAVAATMAAQLYQRYNVPFFLSLVARAHHRRAVRASLIEVRVIRRFSKAPRLILTVATIGVAQILGFLELIPESLNEGDASSRRRLPHAVVGQLRVRRGHLPGRPHHRPRS